MICLGIESTAHTYGVGIASEGKIAANVKDTYIPPEGWGIKPTDAADHHQKVRQEIMEKALEEARLDIREIDAVAFSQGPGLAPCLHKGMEAASDLAKGHSLPLVGVNHCIAHIEVGKLMTGAEDPITLYVSGANTQVLGFVSGRYRCFGETQDIGIGNALDKLGRGLGMQFPAGPKIEQMALKSGPERYIELPYVVKGMDLSFSGIITNVLQKRASGADMEDLCFSFQETAFAMLTEVTERALAHTGKSEVLLTGGVAANKRLKSMLETMCKERGAIFHPCPMALAGDNGAMIAWNGLQVLGASHGPSECFLPAGSGQALDIMPRQRTDDVDAIWAR